MQETKQKEIRERFYEKFGDDSIRNEKIANWWLKEFTTLLQEERGKTIEKIKQSKYKSEKDKFGYDPLDNPIFANEKAVNKKLDDIINQLENK